MKNDRTTADPESSPEQWNPFPMATWLAWIGAILVASMTMVAYAYSTFETKDAAREKIESSRERDGLIVQRLDRIENKVDRVLERPRAD